MTSTILVTGGTGYIGSHTVLELLQQGFAVVILDNLCNSSSSMLPRLEALSGKTIPFVQADIRDRVALDQLFARYAIDAVIHFAALKIIGESLTKPLEYVQNNVAGTVTLLQAMQAANIHRFVFSSSAAVYGDPHTVPIRESFPLQATNPYAGSKLMCENILRDLQRSHPAWQIAILRYFNPIGAHASGLIGEIPNGIPTNIMPYLTQVAIGQLPSLAIFGNDYPTIDGTGVRDYIHVTDLAKGHVSALHYLAQQQGSLTVNLGTGRPVSVKQLVDAFSEATGVTVPHHYAPRRPSDVASSYADPSLAQELMGWHAEKTIVDMCRDAWRWQSTHAGHARPTALATH